MTKPLDVDEWMKKRSEMSDDLPAPDFLPDGDEEELAPIRAIAGGNSGPAEKSYVCPFKEFMGADDEDLENDDGDWIIRNIFPRGEPCLIAGAPKARKTFAMLDASIAVALGEDWLGQTNTAGPKRVLYLNMEDSERRTAVRLWWLLRARGLGPSDVAGNLMVNCKDRFQFQDPLHQQKMQKTLAEFQPDLVILDSFRRAFSGDENSSRDIAGLGQAWFELCREWKVSIAAIHHLKKSYEEGNLLDAIRGSGDLVALVRHIVGISRIADTNKCQLEADGNYVQGFEPISYEVVDGLNHFDKKTVTVQVTGTVSEAKDEGVAAIIKESLVGQMGPWSRYEVANAVPRRKQEVYRGISMMIQSGEFRELGKKLSKGWD